MKITRENLKDWEKVHNGVWESWKKYDRDFILSLSLLNEYSNHSDRDFVLQVDNSRFESVGSIAVSEFEHIDKFLELLSDSTKGTEITKSNLESNGWKIETLDDYVDPELIEEFGEDYNYTWFKSIGEKYYMVLCHGLSNLEGKDWSVHIDNCDFDSLASSPVSTYEQIDRLIEML